MRRYEKKRRSETVNELVEVRCDLCDKAAPKHPFSDERWESPDPAYHGHSGSFGETSVRMRYGWGCSDGGDGYEVQVDLCPECFRDRLVPWLESQGAKVEKKEWDW